MDLSSNEWAIYYKQRLLKGDILSVIEHWLKIIHDDFDDEIPADMCERETKNISELIKFDVKFKTGSLISSEELLELCDVLPTTRDGVTNETVEGGDIEEELDIITRMFNESNEKK